MAHGAQDDQEQLSRDADGVLWRRTGSCCRCGECCMSGDPFTPGTMPPGEVPGACPLLKIDGDRFACGDRQHPYYLGGCNVWPSIPQHIGAYPSCSYVFERVDE